jgi:hypothetical protein
MEQVYQTKKSNRPDRRFKSNRSVVTGAPYSYKDKKPPLSAIKPWALSKVKPVCSSNFYIEKV